jgi:hypothetical protein
MCDPVAGAAPHLHADVTEAVESSAQTGLATTETTRAAESERAETTSKKTGLAPAKDNNWLEQAEGIKSPALGASSNDWTTYAEQLAKTAGISEGMVTDMIRTKKVPSPIESHAANDGTNEQVHGLLSVHGGLLEGGIFGDTTHALKDSAGNALTAADMKDPGKATLAGVQHLKQLIDHYDGNETLALNHYQTGDSRNSDHPLKDWCDPAFCDDSAKGHEDHSHSSATRDSHQLVEKLESAGVSSKHEDHGHSSATGGSHQLVEKLQSAGASSAAGADKAEVKSDQRAVESASTSHAHGSGESSSSNPGLLPDQPGLLADQAFASSESTHSAHGNHGASEHSSSGSQSQTGVTGITGLGTDRALGEYITPNSHSPSQHIGESHGLGFLMHRPTHDAAMETVFGKPASEVISSIQSTLEQTGTYLNNKPDTEKIKGAYLTGNMLMKQAMLPASMFGSEQDAGRAYAQAKLSAIDGDVAGLKNLIEQKGGDTLGLSDEQLRNVWATNEHNNLHGILDAGSPIGQSIHMTSLNDNAGDGTPKGTMGGYNDKGAYPQWGWFNDIQDIGSKFSDLDLNHQIDHNYK